MSIDQVRTELIDGGLHKESVNRLLDHYQSMRSRFSEEEYDESGTHIGNFCENMVNVLRKEMGVGIQTRPSVGSFVEDCLNGKIGTSEPDSIRLQIPRTLRAAYDIRNKRDSVHVNLKVPVNHADTQAGIAMCSWMLAEVLRVYGAGENTDDMKFVGGLINEISKPATKRNPIEKLTTSQDDFDRKIVADILDGLVQINRDEIHPDSEFDSLSTREKVLTLLIAKRAAADLGNLESAEATKKWLAKDRFTTVTMTRIGQILDDYGFVLTNDEGNMYYVPGFRIQDAVEELQDLRKS